MRVNGVVTISHHYLDGAFYEESSEKCDLCCFVRVAHVSMLLGCSLCVGCAGHEKDDALCCVDRGSALGRRLKEREKEKEVDDRDRQREREELDDIRRRLLEEGHPDPEAEIAKV